MFLFLATVLLSCMGLGKNSVTTRPSPEKYILFLVTVLRAERGTAPAPRSSSVAVEDCAAAEGCCTVTIIYTDFQDPKAKGSEI